MPASAPAPRLAVSKPPVPLPEAPLTASSPSSTALATRRRVKAMVALRLLEVMRDQDVPPELLEEEEGDVGHVQGEPAVARFRITRVQAMAFVERARALVRAGRPLCPMCSQPKDPDGHVCPRSNGHVVR